MKKFLLVAFALLFASPALAVSSWAASGDQAKGSWHIQIKNDGDTWNKTFNLGGDTQPFLLVWLGGLDTGESCTVSGSTDVCAYQLNPAAATTVTITISGKLTGFGNAMGSGAATFTYSGTGSNVTLQSKKENGLAFVPEPTYCEGASSGSATQCSLTGNDWTAYNDACSPSCA